MKKLSLFVLVALVLVAAGVLGLAYIVSYKAEDRLVGRVTVDNVPGVYFQVYQEQEFDSATALYYEVRTASGKILSYKHHLVGTHDQAEESDFRASSHDSVVYLVATYPPATEVLALHDLRTGTGFPSAGPQEHFEETYRRGRCLLAAVRRCNNKLTCEALR